MHKGYVKPLMIEFFFSFFETPFIMIDMNNTSQLNFGLPFISFGLSLMRLIYFNTMDIID